MLNLSRALGLICVTVAASSIAVAPAAADHSGGPPAPLPVANLTPADGASFDWRTELPIFSANIDLPDPQPPHLTLTLSRTQDLDHYGLLISTGLGPTGNTVAMLQNATDPTLYEADISWLNGRERTFYWQINHGAGYSTSSVYSLTLIPKPPFLGQPYAVREIKYQIEKKSGAAAADFEKKCKRKSDVRLRCKTTWKTAKTKKWSYKGSWTLTLFDEPGTLNDRLSTKFAGRRASKTCLKKNRFADCAKPAEPWTSGNG